MSASTAQLWDDADPWGTAPPASGRWVGGRRVDDEQQPPLEHPMPGNVLMIVSGMGGDSADPEHAEREVRTPTVDLERAVVVTSLYDPQPGDPLPVGVTSADGALHRPVVDVDLPVKVLPSTTPGHGHLYIDKPMTWSTYLRLLDALVEAELVEPGYVAAARQRGHTAVRVPWVHKGDLQPDLPATPREPVDQLLADIERAASLAAVDELYTLAGDRWSDRHTAAVRDRVAGGLQ